MKIISTTDISRVGNDCYIYESVTLVKQFDLYAVINILSVTGWAETKEVKTLCTTESLAEAEGAYISAGGKLGCEYTESM